MKFIKTKINNVWVIKHNKLIDNRGIFTRKFCKKSFKKNGFDLNFVQFNQSDNIFKGTLRGLHYQSDPFSEIKLISCIKGSVFDVLVDVRKESKTYLKKFSIELSANDDISLLVSKGIAHGFQTLEDYSTLIYFHSEYYNEKYYKGLNPFDPILGINWPIEKKIISDKDKNQQFLKIGK